MLKQLGIVDLLQAIKERVETATDKHCYDAVPDNAPSPFYYMELTGTKPVDSKTMFVTEYSVNMHIIAEKSESSVPVLKYFQELEEAFTEDITIPSDYNFVGQYSDGLQTVKTDETGEKHAVLGMRFLVSYGYKIK